MSKAHASSSRQGYARFRQDYQHGRLDDAADEKPSGEVASAPAKVDETRTRKAKRRQYMREYLSWLKPHRVAVGIFAFLALFTAGLQMVEPLFVRFIVDRVLTKTTLDISARVTLLNMAGAAFLGVIILSSLVNVVKEYRQRLLNTRVMLSLRRTLFDRLIRLPLPKLWDMKTGDILSRLTGDVDTTTGLLQMAIVSPAVSITKLIFAVILADVLELAPRGEGPGHHPRRHARERGCAPTPQSYGCTCFWRWLSSTAGVSRNF